MSQKTKVPWKEKEAAIRALEVGGEVDPNDLIEASRDPSHPCHGDFTWNKDEAFLKQLRNEARKLIRAVGFYVKVEESEVGLRVTQFVPSPDEEDVFVSLPKLRAKGRVSVVVLKEIVALHGNAARAYGIALAKVGIVGERVVSQLGAIRDQVGELKEELGE